MPSGSRFDFSLLANSYDRWYETPVGKVYDRIEKAAVERMLPDRKTGDRLLEIGAGTGHWSRFFAEQGFVVTAMDVSESMVAEARSKGIPAVTFLVADAQSLPYPDGVFDVACAMTTIEFVADAWGAVKEMARCTRPGGKMVFGVLNRHSLMALRRRWKRTPIFEAARFFSIRELRALLARYGDVRTSAVAFILPWRPLLWTASLLEEVGRLLRLPWGDFLVAEVRL